MADVNINKEHLEHSIKNLNEDIIFCSKCHREIPRGETYTKLILSNQILCSECDEGLFEGDNLLGLD